MITTDVCVIGSGFGGGVSALRMAQAGQKVIVLEQGHFWDSTINQFWQGKNLDVKLFQQTNGDLNYWMDIFNISAGVDLLNNAVYAVVGGRGVGGGALVYSGASLRAPSFVFNNPNWPTGIDRTELDPYYTIAENQLQVRQFQWRDVAMKDGAFAWAAKNVGVSVVPHPQVINTNICGGMGWCNNGCLRGAKTTVDRTYIGAAMSLGAQVITGATAINIAPYSNGQWQVTYVQGPSNVPNMTWSGSNTNTVVAKEVFICAGGVNSAALLLRSKSSLPNGISSQVGRNLSRNGDNVIIGILPDSLPSVLDGLDMNVGPVDGATCFQYLYEPPPGFGSNRPPFILQCARMLPMAAALTLDPAGANNPSGNMETFGLGPKHYMSYYGTRMLQIGVMGVDGMDGQVTLTPAGTPTVSFRNSTQTQTLWAAARAAVNYIIGQGAGGKVLPTWDQYRGNDGYTIHPLGSVRMGNSVSQGAVRHDGALWDSSGNVYHGLYVLDCSIMSSPIAVNTSLTTAALAERALSIITARGY